MFSTPPDPPKDQHHESNEGPHNIEIKVTASKRIRHVWQRHLISIILLISMMIGSALYFRYTEPHVVTFISVNLVFFFMGYIICWKCNLWRMESVQKKIFAEVLEEAKPDIAKQIQQQMLKPKSDWT